MIVFPNAKINLGLNVVRKRADGFHDIESLMVPIPLHDILELVLDPTLDKGELIYSRSGLEIAGSVEQDLCWRAVKAIGAKHDLPGVRMHLHKVIPMGAGLGGGSSDGAFALNAVNKLVGLGTAPLELHAQAAELGSDCPFFLEERPQLATGRGELLEPVELELSGFWIMLVSPHVHVPTPEVYKNTEPTGHSFGKAWSEAIVLLNSSLEEQPVHGPQKLEALIPNVMERYVFGNWPEIGKVKEQLIEAGAVHAAMSGSGSTVFGLFNTEPEILEWPAHYRSWILCVPCSA